MMNRLQMARDALKVAFSRLTQREQLVVVSGGAGGALLFLLIVGMLVGGAIAREEARVESKTGQLAQLIGLRGEYRQRQEERAQRLRTLSQRGVRLTSLVEEAARQTGVEIGQLRPEDGEPGPDGVVESRVDLRASGLSADRLEDFLARLEGARGIVIVRHLKLNRPYKKDVVDVELTVSTFKLKGA